MDDSGLPLHDDRIVCKCCLMPLPKNDVPKHAGSLHWESDAAPDLPGAHQYRADVPGLVE
jgi:hypothetical protein